MHGTNANDTRAPYSWCSLTTPALAGECRSDFMLDNSVLFYGSVYAPNSTIQAHNSVLIYGGFAADKVRFFNSVKFFMTSGAEEQGSADPRCGRPQGLARMQVGANDLYRS